MLQCWVKNCHNSFIHRRLYEKGMPTCVQDAFTTLAAYTGRTPATKETILLIAEERSSTLARQSPPTTGSAQGIMAHLARVQALFVYEFIQLFDGSVRVRTSAEKQLPTLLQWVTRMWEAVKQYRGEDSSPGNRPLQWTASEFDREYDASSEMWQSWILTESVRRTHAISVTVANIYQIMTKGWAECTGGVMFTARRGLWEAESAMKWLQLSCAKPPLLVPSLQPGPWISQYAAEEFDDFAKLFWTFIVGKDKIQSWIDKSSNVQALLDAFRSRGYEEIDTGRDYNCSEKRLGQVGAASRFTIHSKVHSGHPGDHEPSAIALSIEQTLDALKTSSVETMFLHVPDRQTPFKDTVRAINDAFKQGKFKKFGLSNYTVAEVKEFIEICEENDYVKPSVYQGHYNAIVRGGERELFPLLRQHNIAFFAFSPAAGGLFSGHADSSVRWSGSNHVAKLYSSFYGQPPVQASIATVRDAAAKYGISAHAAALRWTAFHSSLDGKYGDAVIFGVSKMEQFYKTLDALEVGPLPEEVADAITAIWTTVEGAEPPYHL
ncbi:putative aldo/keto reductase [Jackrogersella minutella]|nr:putative aldo/keto reductase [Jackrogersella minutella]